MVICKIAVTYTSCNGPAGEGGIGGVAHPGTRGGVDPNVLVELRRHGLPVLL
jgi:hypothetical protein